MCFSKLLGDNNLTLVAILVGDLHSYCKTEDMFFFNHTFITYKNNDQHSALMTKPAHMQWAFSFSILKLASELGQLTHSLPIQTFSILTNKSTPGYALKLNQKSHIGTNK